MLLPEQFDVLTPERICNACVPKLEPEQSIAILENGFGIGKLFGCCIFLPYKSIAPVAVKN